MTAYTGPERRGEYTGPERRIVESERIMRLETATNHLAAQVSGLSTALETVNRISARQQELEQETRIATAALRSVQPRVDRLQHDMVPREEHKYRDQERWILTGGAVVLAIHIHEIARNTCGGHRLTPQVPGAEPHEPSTFASVSCDVFFPEATNLDHEYPSTGNVVGMVIYLLLLFAAVRRLRFIRHTAGRRYRYYETP